MANKWLKYGLLFVLCSKQGNKIDGVMHFRNLFSNQCQGFKPLVTYLVPKYWWSTPLHP